MPAIIKKVFFSESKQLLTLSIPLITSGIIETSIGFFSNLFLAHLGVESLAAGALVNWTFTSIMVIIWGTLSAITTLAARYYGQKNNAQLYTVLYAGYLLAIIALLPAMLLLWNLSPIFLFLGQKPAIVALAKPYLHALTWAIIPDFIITVLLQFIAGIGRTKLNLVFSVLFVPLCISLNYALIFGRWGFPSLGIAGIGWGTALSFWIITIGFMIYFMRNMRSTHYPLSIPPLHMLRSSLKEILHVGLPLGFMYCVEIGFFLAMSILMGSINQETLSANQVALQFFWIFSIVSFALAQGITIQVGHSIARNERKLIDYATYLGVFYAFGFMLLIALLYWIVPQLLIQLDFNLHDPKNSKLISLAESFLSLAAWVQLIEAIRFAFFGALRALKDTRFMLFVSILIFWIIALPLGYLLLSYGFEGYGIWWAILLGQGIGVLLLIWRYHRKVHKISL